MREREAERFVVLLIYAFIGSLLYVPWPGIEPATLAFGDNALSRGVTQTGHVPDAFQLKGEGWVLYDLYSPWG